MSTFVPPRPDVPSPPAGGPDDPSARPPASWSWYGALGIYLAAFLLAGLATVPVLVALGGSDATSSGASGPVDIAVTLVADLVIAGVLVIWLRRRHPGWVRIVRFPTRDRLPREFGWGVVAGLILYPAVAFVVGVALTILFQALFGRDIEAPAQLSNDLGMWGAIGAVVLAVVVAPIGEELFFRGIFFRALRDRYGFWVGAIGSALLFGSVHYVPSPWQDAILLQTIMVFTGFGLAWIYERRGNLVANIAAHMTFNTIGIALILLVK